MLTSTPPRPFLSHPLIDGWECRRRGSGEDSIPSRVPGSLIGDLLRAGRIADPFTGRNEESLQWIENSDWEYRLTFDAPPDCLLRNRLELVAPSLDTLATVVLNGVEIGRSESMFAGNRWPVEALIRSRENCLEVRFANPMDYSRRAAGRDLEPISNDRIGGRPWIRKMQCAFGWDWGPRLAGCGFPEAPRLEAWDGDRMENPHLRQRHFADGSVALTLATGSRPAPGRSFRFAIEDCGAVRAESTSADETLTVLVPNAPLWWPNGAGPQPVFEAVVERIEAGRVVECHRFPTAFCEVKLDRSPEGQGERFCFVVNRRPIFATGANWIPAHALPAGGDEATPDLIASASQAHMNCLRVWGGGLYESAAFYEACLRQGILVWQDFAFACALQPAGPPYPDLIRAEAE